MAAPTQGWPADVVHVNEDGWVLINRGRAHGVAPGLRLLVVGTGIRDLRDLYGSASEDGEAPVVLRTRRTFELLEVIHAEERCAVAISERVPAARRPQFYAGPEGELLVWVPLPENYSWPPVGEEQSGQETAAADDADTEEVPGEDDRPANDNDEDDVTSARDGQAAEVASDSQDVPPESADQDDQRWEEALPLNSVSVGDVVVPAVPVTAPAGMATGTTLSQASDSAVALGAQPATVSAASAGTTEGPLGGSWDQQYDWMEPKSGE
jgi:hypothetical protein